MSRENRFPLSAAARDRFRRPEHQCPVSLTSCSGSHHLDKRWASGKWRTLIARISRRRYFQSGTRKASHHKIGTRVSSNGCIIFRTKRNCWKKFGAPQKNGSSAQTFLRSEEH